VNHTILLYASVLALVSASTSAETSDLDAARLTHATVHYASASVVRTFPVPAVHWRRPGLMQGPAERSEIENKVIYPFLLGSKEPVAAIVIEFHPGMEDRLGILIVWSNGISRESAISRSVDGHYDAEAYKVLLMGPTP
jgi:hypothetical protein